jgi:hypothetical protein
MRLFFIDEFGILYGIYVQLLKAVYYTKGIIYEPYNIRMHFVEVKWYNIPTPAFGILYEIV